MGQRAPQRQWRDRCPVRCSGPDAWQVVQRRGGVSCRHADSGRDAAVHTVIGVIDSTKQIS